MKPVAPSISTSVIISSLSHYYGDDLRGLLETARIADEAGIGQLVLTDHVVMGENLDRYPYGRFPYPLEEPWPEPLTTLAAVAGCTKRIRLGTGVLIAALRPAVLLAKTLATLDALSGGRVDLGVGTGWQREEYQALGLPFEARGARLDDTLRACRTLPRRGSPPAPRRGGRACARASPCGSRAAAFSPLCRGRARETGAPTGRCTTA